MSAAACAGLSCLALQAAPAWAQATDVNVESSKDSIVVTARRRDETLLETPTTLSVIDGSTLAALGVNGIQSAIALTPNAVVQRDPENFNTYINIRGIRRADINAEPNFGLYRDGIFYGGQRSNLGALVDVARIEVLRGPQAGLYGRNAVGGAVDIVHAAPAETFGGYATLRYARYDRLEAEGALNLPVTSTVAVRATGWLFDQSGGEFYNLTLGKEIDRSRDAGVRLGVRATPTDRLEVVWTGEYAEHRGPSIRTYSPDGTPNSILGAPIVSPPETPRTVRRDVDGRARYRQYYLSQTVNYRADAGTLSLLTAYRNYRFAGVQDFDGTALSPSDGPGVLAQILHRDEATESLYGELLWRSPDAGRLRWMAGLSYFREAFDVGHTIAGSIDLDYFGIPIGTATVLGGQPLKGSRISTRSYSGFVEASYAFTSALSVTADLRYTEDRKRLRYAQGLITSNPTTDPVLFPFFGAALPGFTLATRSTFRNWSPSLNLDLAVAGDAHVYALYSTGFRAGGFNTSTSSPDLIPYGQERARNYEIGAKGSWLGGRLTASAAVFYMTQSDLLLAQDDLADQWFGFSYLANVGDARTWGTEIEIEGRPLQWLTGHLAVGHLDARFTRGSSFGTSVAGDPVPYTRSWTINGRIDATYPVAPKTRLVATANLRIETGGVLDRGLPYENLGKLDLVGGVERGNLRLTAFVTNLLDDRVAEFRFLNGQVSLSQGRRYGIEARLSL